MMSYKTAQEIRDFIISCKASTEIYLQALDSPKNMSNCKTCNGFGFMFTNMNTGSLYAPKEGYIDPPSKHEGKQPCPHCDPKGALMNFNQAWPLCSDPSRLRGLNICWARYNGDGSLCKHNNMISAARYDECPDCGYYFYYGDAYADRDDDNVIIDELTAPAYFRVSAPQNDEARLQPMETFTPSIYNSKSLNLYKNQPCITFMDEENIETITVSSEVVKIIKAAVMALDPNDIEKLKNILTIEQK